MSAPVSVPGAVELLHVIGLPAQTSKVQVALGDGEWETMPHDRVAHSADLGAPGSRGRCACGWSWIARRRVTQGRSP